MWINSNGQIYFGDCALGDRAATPEEIQAWEASRLPDVSEAINTERDRRIVENFSFGGTAFDFDDKSKSRVTGAATLAGFAIGAGALAGDLLWSGGSGPFTWISKDNSLVTMDAQTCFAFGQAAAAHERAHIFSARALKDMTPVPANFTDDEYWP